MNSSKTLFENYPISSETIRAIQEMGFKNPSPIQEQTLPILLENTTDFLGLASTGTGKTAAFGIPLLEKIDPRLKGVQGLILCPTRELAKQVSEQINLLARYKSTKALAIYGGADYGGQIRALKEGVSIIVGTPGRIIDHLDHQRLNLNSLQVVILDEADEMISMGFKEEIETILKRVNQKEKHQTWLFSATMDRDIRKIADQFLKNPRQVSIQSQNGGSTAQVSQFYFKVHEDQKPQVLESLIDSAEDFHGLVFCQTKALVIELTQSLKRNGYSADCLHGDMDQSARERTMKAFRNQQVRIMVCTDVAARGIDVKDLTHVINYSLPRETENYVHRIGRTGRGGKEGIAWNLVNPSHMGLIPRIEKLTKAKMNLAKVPDFKTILKIKLKTSKNRFEKLSEPTASQSTMIRDMLSDSGWSEMLEKMSKEEIVSRFLAQTIKIREIKQSVHEEPRKKEGSTRMERRKEFLDRNQKKKTKNSKGRSRFPDYGTFRNAGAFIG